MSNIKFSASTLIQHALEATQATRTAVEQGIFGRLMGCVGAAIETDQGKLFTGVNLEFYCSMGFCAEHSAISDMIKHGYSRIYQVVAVTFEGVVIPPCGRCREIMFQLNKENVDAVVHVGNTESQLLSELLPNRWQDLFDASEITI